MNIFKALSQGDGSINETNITSFLSYILNETNEFSASFLLLFLEEIGRTIDGFNINDILNFTGNNYRQKTVNFKEKYTYSAIPEYRLKSNSETQYVDILLTISEKFTEKDCCYILIENKIKKSALKKDQCSEQFRLFNQIEDFQENTPVFSILITPDIDSFESMMEDVKQVNPLSLRIKWESEKETSLIDLFKQLIKLENNSDVSPIDINTQYIIKSFIDYISTELSIKEKTYNFSFAGAQVVEESKFKLNGLEFLLKRFDNKMIRIFDINNEVTDQTVKPILREIISEYSLDVELERKPGIRKNTQLLGRDVIKALNRL